jgi:hypothetical protein
VEFLRWGATKALEKKYSIPGSLYNPLEDVPQRAQKQSVAPCNTGSLGSLELIGSALVVPTALNKKTNAAYQEGDNCFVLTKQLCYDQEQEEGIHQKAILVDTQEPLDGDESFFAGKRFFFTELN